MSAPSRPESDHFSPAGWLIRNPKVLDAKTAPTTRTLDRAETIFATYNEMLT